MDLTSLANVLIKAGAPILGGVVGGPAGAAILPVIVNSIGQMLGLPEDATAEDVETAIVTNPQGAQAAQQAEQQIGKTAMEIEAAMMETVNQTARLELQSDSWFVRHARPFNIWVIGMVTLGFGLCFVVATGYAVFYKDVAALNILLVNAGVLGVLLAPCAAVAGLSAWGRTKEKLAGVAGAAGVVPALADAAAKAVRKAVR
jgi:hypothetical protein